MAQEKISHHQWKHVSFTNIDFSFNFSLKFSSPHLQLEGDDDEADEAAGERGVGSLGIIMEAGSSFILFLPELVS